MQERSEMANATGPLAGLRLVELDAIGPVPLAAMVLADMGADVVRIARAPKTGQTWEDTGGAVLHRNRPHVHLDLKEPSQRDQALALIAEADALLEGFRPGVTERLGLGPDVCLQANPRLVYARMTGWGQTGPLAPRAGHDLNYIGLTGVLQAIGDPALPPPPPLNLVGDYGGGAMFAVSGILAGVFQARTTGRGQVVDIGMTDGSAVLGSFFHAFSASGLWQDARGVNLLDGSKPFYRCYACLDGGFVAVAALEPQFFAQLLAGLGVPNDRFRQYDPAGWGEMESVFSDIFAARSRDAWAEVFAQADACVSPVLAFGEVAAHPHNAGRETFVEVDGIVQPSPAPRFSHAPTRVDPSRRGLTTVDDVLSDWGAQDAVASPLAR